MKPLSVLMVDDDQLMIEVLEQFFRTCQGCINFTANDSQEALAKLRLHPFDVMLTNVNHPGMDGLSLTQLVRRHNGPPVIVMTGYYITQNRRLAFASGSRACLRKPIKLKRLAEIVELVVVKGVLYIGEE